MKKLLTLSFAVLFVVALSSLSFAQPTLAPEAEADAVVVMDGAAPVSDCCPHFGCAPFRPIFRGGCYASNCGNPCFNPCPAPCPMSCPAPCPLACPRSFAYSRPVVAPQCDCAADPCAYPAYGNRAPLRGFLSRVFTPRYYDSGCCY